MREYNLRVVDYKSIESVKSLKVLRVLRVLRILRALEVSSPKCLESLGYVE